MEITYPWNYDSTILLGEYGSKAHGTGDADSDTDLMGVAVEPPEYVMGLARFEQAQSSTFATGQRAHVGDVEATVYSLRKYARLAAAGNPTILLALFLPHYDVLTDAGRVLVEHRHLFLSRNMAGRFLGYMRSQRGALVGAKNKRVKRPDLVEQFGYDTKFAYHMVKLGMQGVELLRRGHLTIPFEGDMLAMLREIRAGEHELSSVLDLADELEQTLRTLHGDAELPELSDNGAINQLLVQLHESHWAQAGHH